MLLLSPRPRERINSTPSTVPWSQSKGIPSTVLSQERKKRGQCWLALPLLPQGNCCKTLARKGKSTKCLLILPATVFFQRKGEGLCFYPCLPICLWNYLHLYANLIRACISICKYIWIWKTAFAFKDFWEIRTKLRISMFISADVLIDVFRNRVQGGAKCLSIVKSLTFHSKFNNRQASRHKAGYVFLSVQRNLSGSWVLLLELGFPSSHTASSSRGSPAFLSALSGKRSCSGSWPRSGCTAHLHPAFPTFHWHASMRGTWEHMGYLLTCQLHSWMTFISGRYLASKRLKWQFFSSACCTSCFIFTCSGVAHMSVL